MKTPDLTGVRIFTKNEHRLRLKERSSQPKQRKIRTTLTTDLARERLKIRVAITMSLTDKDFFFRLGDKSISRGVHLAAGLASGKLKDIHMTMIAARSFTPPEPE